MVEFTVKSNLKCPQTFVKTMFRLAPLQCTIFTILLSGSPLDYQFSMQEH